MAPEPENILPEHWYAASGDREDMRAEVSVAVEHDQSGRQDREGEQDENGRDQHVPREDRHTEHRHAGRAQIEDRGRDIDTGKDRGEAREQQSANPKVRACAGRVDRVRQWRVRHPAKVRGAAGDEEARQHRDRTREIQPVTERVESRKGHIGCADLNGHDDVREGPESEGSHEEVDHHRTVHGEELVVLREGHQVVVRSRELSANQFGEGATDDQHDDRRHGVRHPDDLVVGRGQPLQDARGAVLFVVFVPFSDRWWIEYVSH